MEFPDVANDSVTVPSSASLKLGDTGTIEAWIYPTEFNADSEIIGKGAVAESYAVGLCGGAPGDEFEGGTAQNIGFALYDAGGIRYLLRADNYTLTANRWVHVACVWDRGASPQMAIYINGIQEAASDPGIPSVRTNDEDLVIGFQGLTSGNFVGDIDEVRIYNYVLNDQEIKSLYNYGKVTTVP